MKLFDYLKMEFPGLTPEDTKVGRDADLVVMVDCQIPSDDLIVHFF
ncbi:TPA: hypothetical protein RRT20_005311 [Klebsiella pneumoniae]|nr:hypothetical protein [Klebsiella pneumoniae]HDZ0615727.1 hypothetical protein [Klebsiella pneumoniae]